MADNASSSRLIRAIEDSFPIVEINRLAVPERNSFKPIYQMHKWFARRASCVFRAILLGCLKPLPLDEHGKPTKTGAQVIMEEFYKDHTDDPDTKDKVILDPFMGGGTTVVEALRLGCRVIGIDLNPVAWFIVKTEVEPVDLDALQDAFERLAERPVPWSGKSVRETLLSQYHSQYPCCGAGREEADIIYTFWVKSAICTACKKQVPLFKDYIIAQKSPSIRYWRDAGCPQGHKTFDWEIEPAALVAEPSLQINSPTYSAGVGRSTVRWAYSSEKSVQCPWCQAEVAARPAKKKPERKKVPLAVLLCPFCEAVWQWRGEVPDSAACPICRKDYNPLVGNIPGKGEFLCASCGHRDDIIQSILGVGEVLRVNEGGPEYRADVAFESSDGRRLETLPLSRLEQAPDLWERLALGDFDDPLDYALKQLAFQFPLANSGGKLSCSRTDLLPHQILLTHDVVAASRRRFLIADEVGLGKTIETGMIIRELVARGEAERALIVAPAGLTRNWQTELAECFGLHFDILGIDFTDANLAVWETHLRVIASIDRLKQPRRKERLAQATRWDLVVFDEAHHLSRTKVGGKVNTTQNYRLAEALRGRTRDLLFLSATPHQGDPFQFWSLLQLLDDSLFASPDAMLDHRGLLNRVMMRRIKREVTDAEGQPLFMRRQVHTQVFAMAHRERIFYDQLTGYLREGYGAAGIGEAKTTANQRAIGFVMASFQKIMASSPRAIRQALRRRLLVLLARQQMALEERTARSGDTTTAEKIQALEYEMRTLAMQTLGLPLGGAQWAEAGAHVAQVKQRLARKAAEEETSWALDGDEEGAEAIYAETEIPGEAVRVRELLKLVPDGTDRKFDTLVRAIEDLRRIHPAEKFIIFTQYRETQEYLREELGKIYSANAIVTIKGGPLADKIAAVEVFWEPDGAQFLISTSAGGEGINLQCARILFNYDLPWNPMAIEQRIGRIHRYGQQDTAQIYTLVAEDTVEQRIYLLLEGKLLEIARTIGKVDPVTGQATEDFRSEILGFLGASPSYQDLYKKALVDRDYIRTEQEMAEAMDRARRASDALRSLAQDLSSFNLGQYMALRGQFTLEDLRDFCLAALPRLGGAILPDGECYRVVVPSALQSYPRVEGNYRGVTFNRKLAMRRKQARLLGLGHPLVDALLAEWQTGDRSGTVTLFDEERSTGRSVRIHCLAHVTYEDGSTRRLLDIGRGRTRGVPAYTTSLPRQRDANIENGRSLA